MYDPEYSLHLLYYEDGNFFVDSAGEIVYNLFNIITPRDLFMFKNDSSGLYDKFPYVKDRNVLVCLIYIPAGDIGWLLHMPKIKAAEAYANFEEYERSRMSRFGG